MQIHVDNKRGAPAATEGLNCCVNEPQVNCSWDLMQGSEFISTDNVFKGVVKAIGRVGKSGKNTVSTKKQHILAYSDNKRSVLIRISILINLP